MKTIATALALLLSVVATGESMAQIALSSLEAVEWVDVSANKTGVPVYLAAVTTPPVFLGYSGADAQRWFDNSWCVTHEWTANIRYGIFDTVSTCDPAGDASYTVDYGDTTEGSLYSMQLPLELVASESGIAPGTPLFLFNTYSYVGDMTTGRGWRILSHPEAWKKALSRIEEISDTLDGRLVVWMNQAFLQKYYSLALDEEDNLFVAGTGECRNWNPEMTATVERLYVNGVVFVSDSGLGIQGAGDPPLLQRYPACLPEVIAVATAERELPHNGDGSTGASLSAPTAVDVVTWGDPVTISRPDFATAYVAGASILLLRDDPTLTPLEVKTALEEGGKPTTEVLGFYPSFLSIKGALEMSKKIVGIENSPLHPESISIEAYPNPYRAGDMLNLEVAGEGSDRSHGITLYDILGREVRKLHEGEVVLDLPSGLYLLRSKTSDGTPLTRLLTVVH